MNARPSTRGVAKPTRRPKKLGEQGWDSHPGWHQTEKLPVKRNPWHGLTPEEAYRKGVEAGKEDERDQQRIREEHQFPERRPRA